MTTELADRRAIFARWHVGLRFAVFGFLLATLPLADRVFGYHVRYALAAPVATGALALNAIAARRLARAPAGRIPSFPVGVVFDLVAMTAVLAASGGAANPLSALFFVHVALAAAILPTRVTLSLAGLAALLFGALFLLPSGSCCPSHPGHGAFSTHLVGMWLAFVLGAGLVATFVTRVRHELEAREAEIVRLRREADEAARFVALGTLAAGTAHELGTPLGTVAVLAGELEATAPTAEVRAAARDIGAQIARCREVIARMRGGARAAMGDLPGTSLGPAVARAVAAFRAANPGAGITLLGDEVEVRVALGDDDVEAAVCALLDNALHATRAAGSTEPIRVVVAGEGAGAALVVEDPGGGFAAEVEGRVGEPFVTTKAPGEGMGLGLYLVRTLLAPIGGRLEVARRARGTAVTLRLACVGEVAQ